MVLCAARVFIATITRITLLQEVCLFDEARRTGVTMEDNEEEDFDDHFPGNAGFGAFDDDIPMEEPEVDVAENDPSIAVRNDQ